MTGGCEQRGHKRRFASAWLAWRCLTDDADAQHGTVER
jgi:hypothetical protein